MVSQVDRRGRQLNPASTGIAGVERRLRAVIDPTTPCHALRRHQRWHRPPQEHRRGRELNPAASGIPSTNVLALAMVAGSPGTLYAGTQPGGVSVTVDAAANWTATGTIFPVRTSQPRPRYGHTRGHLRRHLPRPGTDHRWRRLVDADHPRPRQHLHARPRGGTPQASSTAGSPTGSIVSPACGDGTVDFGEQCDDGNVLGGDCCPRLASTRSPARRASTRAIPARSIRATARVRASTISPAPGSCRGLSAARRACRCKKSLDPAKDSLIWKWSGAPAVDKAGLGLPASSTGLALCVTFQPFQTMGLSRSRAVRADRSRAGPRSRSDLTTRTKSGARPTASPHSR